MFCTLPFGFKNRYHVINSIRLESDNNDSCIKIREHHALQYSPVSGFLPERSIPSRLFGAPLRALRQPRTTFPAPPAPFRRPNRPSFPCPSAANIKKKAESDARPYHDAIPGGYISQRHSSGSSQGPADNKETGQRNYVDIFMYKNVCILPMCIPNSLVLLFQGKLKVLIGNILYS